MIHALEEQTNKQLKLHMSSSLLKKVLRGDLLVLNSYLHMEKLYPAGEFLDLVVEVITRSSFCLFN